jgi:hypothetical protein
MGFTKNKYIGRTFIAPTQELREAGVDLKLNPISSVVTGKRVVLIDDSIVRGTTSKRIIEEPERRRCICVCALRPLRRPVGTAPTSTARKISLRTATLRKKLQSSSARTVWDISALTVLDSFPRKDFAPPVSVADIPPRCLLMERKQDLREKS